MKTFSIKKEEIKKKWVLIDADNAVLGRLAVISANILRGKNKPEYTPNQDCGDNLIIINADKIHLTGKKETKKVYYKHTGHPGGLKETTPEKMKLNNKSTDIIKKAIQRMIPKGPLGIILFIAFLIISVDLLFNFIFSGVVSFKPPGWPVCLK